MVKGKDLIEHIEKCDHCIMIEEMKDSCVKRFMESIEESMAKAQEECFNNAGRD